MFLKLLHSDNLAQMKRHLNIDLKKCTAAWKRKILIELFFVFGELSL